MQGIHEYDSAGRLWQVYLNGSLLRTWTYDANGNRSDGTYDSQDRQQARGATTFSYGNNGELLSKSGSGAATYDYDAHGNLRNATVGAVPISYVIDGLGRRIGKRKNSVLVQGFIYDGSRIVAELDGTGTVISRFVYATQGHSPDLIVKSSATYRIIKDHLGSPRLVVNTSGGAVAQSIDYDEWGNVLNDSSPGFQPFGFAGGLFDGDTKLARFGARDYDAATGRWTTKDLSRFDGGMNLYAYAVNDPINLIDPTGYGPIGAAVGGGLGATAGAAAGFLLGGGSGLVGLAGGPAVLATVPAGAVVGTTAGLFAGGAAGALWGDKVGDAIGDWLENRRKGERNTAGKPTGTNNPDKHLKWDEKSQRWYMKDPHTGKPKFKPPGYRPPPNGFFPFGLDDDDDDESNSCP